MSEGNQQTIDERDSKQIAADIMNEVKGGQKPADNKEFDITDVPPEALGEQKPKEPAKPAEAKPAEAKPADDEIPELKKADKRTQEAFHRLRTQLVEANERLQQLQQAKPASASTDQAVQEVLNNKKQVEELQAKLNQAYDEIGKYSLAADPRFKAQYEDQQAAIVDQIKNIAKEWDVKEDIIDSIVRASPKKRVEIINEVAPDMAPMLSGPLFQYDHLANMKKMALERHQETRQALEQRNQQQAKMINQAARETLFKGAIMNVLKSGHFVFNTIEGNEKWNKHVSILHRKVSELFSGDDQMKQAEALVLGVAAPVYREMYLRERSKRMQIEKDMQERYSARAGLDSSPSDDKSVRQKQPDQVDAKDVVGKILSEEL